MEVLGLKCVNGPYNFSTNCSFSNNNPFNNDVAGLESLAAMFIVFLIGVFSVEINKQKSDKILPMTNIFGRIFNGKTISRVLLISTLLVTLPLTSVFLLFISFHKLICSYIISRKDENFVGFLDSFDVFWSLEDNVSKSIINVLGVIESDSSQNLVNNIREKLQNIALNENIKKIFYRRNEKYGFYYWRKFSSININEYVELYDFKGKDNLYVDDLENVMSDVQNQLLPYNDKGLFKILVTKQRVGSTDKERGEHGIIFRIHHSVGDGVALIEFLCQMFADKSDTKTVNMFTNPVKTDKRPPYKVMDIMQKLCKMPVCFVDGLLRKPDQNSLHGPALSGHKLFKWTASDEKLLVMVKEIKENIADLNFTGILLAALSNGLQKCLSQNVAPIPEEIAVVLPVRFPKSASEGGLLLKNDFSVTTLDLAMKISGNLKEIKDRCNDLRLSADPLTNYYFLKLISSIMPKPMLLKMLDCSQATTVFSNLPGPERITICGGNGLKSLLFFVPNTGTIGLGVTALCYGGDLRFAAMGDKSIIPSSEYLNILLEGMVNEVKRLHKQYVL